MWKTVVFHIFTVIQHLMMEFIKVGFRATTSWDLLHSLWEI
jgi:hypothetical protein